MSRHSTGCNMKGVCVLFLALCLHRTSGAVYMEIVNENPGSPGRCRDPMDNSLHAAGSSWLREGVCEQLLCLRGDSRGKMMVQHQGCGTVRAEPPCEVIPVDLSRPYPLCCPSAECPRDMEDEHQAILK
ncbi:U-scoloptoxin(16)-Er9a [Bacillus rossius redtenbacheri]|uniref:U-scoloptoxin(16)-Er9a n=1 Tax=Bacillus rossius redtenbacheri TaxID=93214 RepID=UPI002FDDC689